jgi:hypothetical protein
VPEEHRVELSGSAHKTETEVQRTPN